MISANIDTYRFFDGPGFHYNGTSVPELAEIIGNPEEQTAYLNQIKGVDTNIDEVRQVAAAGILRAHISRGDVGLINDSLGLLLSIVNPDPEDYPLINEEFTRLPLPVTGMLDSASVIATRLNRPADTIDALAGEIEVTEPTLVIGIAQGGVISAAKTFLELGNKNSVFRAVKFSRLKMKDEEPDFYPYPAPKIAELVDLAEGRQVVVHDEDRATGETLDVATKYFADMFEQPVVGISPVIHGRRIEFNPQIVRAEPSSMAA